MLHAMRGKGIETYATYTSDEEREALPKECVALRIPHFKSKFKYASIKEVRSIIKKYRIDVIYASSSIDLSIALFASWGTPARVVGYRGTQAKIRRSDPTYYLGILNPRIAHVMCATEDIKQQLARFISPDRMTVSPKPYEVMWMEDVWAHPRSVAGIPSTAFQVICLANTKGRSFKGLRILIRALELLTDTDIHLIYLGEYDKADYKLAQNGPAAKQIHMLGPHKDAVYYLPGKDVCICPSTRDASPRSLREAMACKVACIVTDIPGARDLVVDGRTGIIVQAGSPQAIAEGIRVLAADRAKTKMMGEAGYQRIRTDYTMEEYVRRLKGVFDAIMTK